MTINGNTSNNTGSDHNNSNNSSYKDSIDNRDLQPEKLQAIANHPSRASVQRDMRFAKLVFVQRSARPGVFGSGPSSRISTYFSYMHRL